MLINKYYFTTSLIFKSRQLINSFTLTLTILGSLTTLPALVQKAEAITINRNFIPAGEEFSPNFIDQNGQPVQAENSPTNINKERTGNLSSIFNSAAGLWEDIFNDPSKNTRTDTFTININFGWLDLGSREDVLIIGESIPLSVTDNRDPIFGKPKPPFPGEVISTDFVVLFNNNSNIRWFLDNTPPPSSIFRMGVNTTADITQGSEEYRNFEFPRDPIGFELNQIRIGIPTPDSVAFERVDLYTVALHEIGHTLGFYTTSNLNVQRPDGSTGPLGLKSGFEIETSDGDIDITSPRPFTDRDFKVASKNAQGVDVGPHLEIPARLMSLDYLDDLRPDVRILPTGIDVLAVAQVSGFEEINLRAVPEPTSLLGLLAFSALGAGSALKRERKQSKPTKEKQTVETA